MKIFQGIYKGKSILFYKNEKNSNRPLKSIVINSIFNSLKDYWKDAIILDLFSNSGQFAMNSISCGAKYLYCNDIDINSIKILRKNVNLLNINKNYINISKSDYKIFLQTHSSCKFNIIFLDAPYNSNYNFYAFCYIFKNNMYFNNAIIILHSEFICENLTNFIKKHQLIHKIKKFGRSIIVIIFL